MTSIPWPRPRPTRPFSPCFPAVLLIASILTASHSTRGFIREISYAIGGIMPSGTSSSVLTFFEGRKPAPVRMIVTTSLITLWTGSGVMISWMEGFRRAYQMPPKIWNAHRRAAWSPSCWSFWPGCPWPLPAFCWPSETRFRTGWPSTPIASWTSTCWPPGRWCAG